MRNDFRGNLVGALKNKKLLRLQKTKETISFTIPGISRIFFGNFRNFVSRFYIKICLVIIMIFLFSSNKKLQKKPEQEKFIT